MVDRTGYHDATAEAEAAARRANGKDDSVPLNIVTYADAKPQIDTPYLIKSWLHVGELSAVIGQPGCGKTFLSLDMDAHIAAGADWFDHRSQQFAVVHLAAEGGMAIFNRIYAIKMRLGFDDSLPLAIIPVALDLVTARTDADALTAAIMRAGAIFSRPVGKLTIDTVSRVLAGADENAPDGMGALIHNIDRIRARTGAHVTLVHHAPKDGSRGKGGRGHSSLWGAIDTEIDVDRDPTTKIARAIVAKQRNAFEGAEASFDLEAVTLGTDADGDGVTSCIIRPATPTKATNKNPKLSAPCAIALEALRQAINEGGQPAPTSNHIPASARVVSVEIWRRFAYAKAISNEGRDAKRKAFKRASEQLQARKLVAGWQDWVWLP